MDTEAMLLRAICEQPEDDTPRLVFADWLTEQGGAVNAAWALGIRAEIAIGHGAADELTLQRARMFAQPFARARVCERLGVPPDWPGVEWDRGFPCAVSAEFGALAAAWPRMAFRAPVRTLRFFELSADQAEEFGTWLGLQCLRELSVRIGEAENPDDVLVLLAECPGLARLETLDAFIRGPREFGESAALAVLDSPHLAGLKSFGSWGWQFGPLPEDVEDRLVARFGPRDDIPF